MIIININKSVPLTFPLTGHTTNIVSPIDKKTIINTYNRKLLNHNI